MNDREFLMWLHERLEHVYNEKPMMDYMHKLRAIIRSTPKDNWSANCGTFNSLEELKRFLASE